MIKAIVIIRTSTVRQEIEAQRIESVDYAKTFGYKDEEIVVIGEQGASAIKVDEAYKRNLNKVYETIEYNPSVECVVAWGLDRIARKPIPFYQLKDFLVSHKIQLRIKNPTLYLLNEDGSINNGMEAAISLFLTLAEQEMRTKQERFMRAKKYISEQGKFIGARYMMYGYTTDDNGYLVIYKEEADIVKLIFDLYCAGGYSARSLAREINERGYRFTKGVKFGEGHIVNILKNTAYIGYNDKNSMVHKYPAIIEEEQFKKAKEIRDSRNRNIDKSRTRVNLAINILKCWECGGNYMYVEAGTRGKKDYKYVCYNRQKKYRLNPKNVCLDSCAVQQKPFDEVLRDLAYIFRARYQDELSATRVKEMEERTIVLTQKIETARYDLEHINDKFTKLVDAYTDELLSKKQYEERVDKLKAEQLNLATNLQQFSREKEDITRALKKDYEEEDLDAMTEKLIKSFVDNKFEEDLHKVKKVIDQFIKRAYAKKIVVNKTNLTVFMFADFNNKIYNFIFHQHHGKCEGLYNYIDWELKPYPHNFLDMLDFKENNGISHAVQAIMDSKEAMIDLEAKVRLLNEQMLVKLG